mgnify:CR=1 FL=1
MDISSRIEQLPKILGLNSLRQLALEIEFSPQQVTRLAQGKSKPGFDILHAILNKFPVNPSWLMKGEGTPLLEQGEGKKHQPMIDTDLYDMRKLVSEVDQIKRRLDELEGNK